MRMQRSTNSHLDATGLTAKVSAAHHAASADMSGTRMSRQQQQLHSNHGDGGDTSSSRAKGPKSKIIRHTKRPPSERRFKCEQCDRMFFTRKDVKRHMVVHTGVRNFACPFCQQRFGRKDHLVRHAKKSHNRDTRSSATSMSSGGPASNCVRKTTGGGGPVSAQVSSTSAHHHHLHHASSHPGLMPTSSAGSGGGPQTSSLALPNTSLLDAEHNLPHHGYHGGGSGHSSDPHSQHPSLLILHHGPHHHMGNGGYGSALGSLSDGPSHYTPNGLTPHQEELIQAQQHHLKQEPNHHYSFPFSVASSSSFVGSPLMSSCFLGSNAANRSFGVGNGLPGHHHPHSLQLQSVCHDQPNSGALSAFLDVNPSLPHFNQAFP